MDPRLHPLPLNRAKARPFAAALDAGPPTSAGHVRAVVCVALHTAVALWLVLCSPPAQALDADRVTQSAAQRSPRAQIGWRTLQPVLRSAINVDEVTRVTQINDFFNRRIAFRSDLEAWGVLDYWASPMELFDKGEGDCEDYVIAKYFSLLAVGVPVAKLRLVYVRAWMGAPTPSVQAHMVLAYYGAPGADPLILDNLIEDIRPASKRSDLTPVFSFNSEGMWQGTGAQSNGDPVARLSRWRDLLTKALNEGFGP
jgi:predicted transglutaminase-like cysteine proteinase